MTRDGGMWDYRATATDATTGARVQVSGRGGFSYYAPDAGAQCGAATATPQRDTPLPNAVPPTSTAPPFGTGTEICTGRGPALDDATAATVAHAFLTGAGLLPDPSSIMQVLPLDTHMPTLRTVRWAATAPNGGRFIGRDAQRDSTVTVGPNKNVTSASGPIVTSSVSSRYRLRSAADLAATLQAGEAYLTLALPRTDNGMAAIAFRGDQPLDVHITGAALGYSLAYTFDVQPYLLPVVIYTGTANTPDSLTLGKEIGFTAYVDAVAHPAPQPAPVTPTIPLPTAPEITSLASFTVDESSSLTRADFDALAAALGFDIATATVTTTPVGDRSGFLATFPDGSNLSANYGGGGWQYDNGGRSDTGATGPVLSPEAALATVQRLIAAHRVDLNDLGTPTVAQPPNASPQTFVCYPLLLANDPIVSTHGDPECGLDATIGPGGARITLTARPLLLSLQRSGSAAPPTMPPAGTTAITAREALDTLAIAPQSPPVSADPSALADQLARLYIEDEPENATHHFLGNTFVPTRGQAAPNSFTVDRVTLAYIVTQVPNSPPDQAATLLQPVWLISGQIDIGNRHRIAPFTYLYPASR
jgi:hypothetical protein